MFWSGVLAVQIPVLGLKSQRRSQCNYNNIIPMLENITAVRCILRLLKTLFLECFKVISK